jgi:hypothetical protein
LAHFSGKSRQELTGKNITQSAGIAPAKQDAGITEIQADIKTDRRCQTSGSGGLKSKQ